MGDGVNVLNVPLYIGPTRPVGFVYLARGSVSGVRNSPASHLAVARLGEVA